MILLRAKIWNEQNRNKKINLEIELLKKSGLNPFIILADFYDAIEKLVLETILQENPDIGFKELLKKARIKVITGRRDTKSLLKKMLSSS